MKKKVAAYSGQMRRWTNKEQQQQNTLESDERSQSDTPKEKMRYNNKKDGPGMIHAHMERLCIISCAGSYLLSLNDGWATGSVISCLFAEQIGQQQQKKERF